MQYNIGKRNNYGLHESDFSIYFTTDHNDPNIFYRRAHLLHSAYKNKDILQSRYQKFKSKVFHKAFNKCETLLLVKSSKKTPFEK